MTTNKMKWAKPCLHCGSKDIVWSDCGYSSFNCGEAKCNGCGFVLKLDCSCFPEKEIRAAWNAQEKKAKEKLERLRKEIKEVVALLGDKIKIKPC